MGLTRKPVVGSRPFIVLPYYASEGGQPKPDKPRFCPEGGDYECSIVIKKWRKRKCGPNFPLAGMYCKVHDLSFTIYPPGWSPYSRRPLLLVDHGGCAVETSAHQMSWSFTLFKALYDASKGNFWPEEVSLGPIPDSDPQQSRRTQRRHIAGALRLLGLSGFQDTRQREIVSHEIQLGLMMLEDCAARIRAGPTLGVMGTEGVRVLAQLPGIRSAMSGLLALGERQGYWRTSTPPKH